METGGGGAGVEGKTEGGVARDGVGGSGGVIVGAVDPAEGGADVKE